MVHAVPLEINLANSDWFKKILFKYFFLNLLIYSLGYIQPRFSVILVEYQDIICVFVSIVRSHKSIWIIFVCHYFLIFLTQTIHKNRHVYAKILAYYQ